MLSLVRAKLLVAFLVSINNSSVLLLFRVQPMAKKEREARRLHGLSLPYRG